MALICLQNTNLAISIIRLFNNPIRSRVHLLTGNQHPKSGIRYYASDTLPIIQLEFFKHFMKR